MSHRREVECEMCGRPTPLSFAAVLNWRGESAFCCSRPCAQEWMRDGLMVEGAIGLPDGPLRVGSALPPIRGDFASQMRQNGGQ